MIEVDGGRVLDAPDGEDPDLPPTPEEIQPTLDPELLDTFYRLGSTDVSIARGQEPAIPRPWFGMPRAAVVYNLSYVYDETEEEWVRQNPFSGGGGGVFEIVFTDVRTVPATGFETIDLPITMGELDGDVLIPSAAIPAGVGGFGGNVVHQEGGAFGDDILYELKYQDFDNEAVQMVIENTDDTDQEVRVKVFRG